MKNLHNYITLILAALFLSSCLGGSDDDPNNALIDLTGKTILTYNYSDGDQFVYTLSSITTSGQVTGIFTFQNGNTISYVSDVTYAKTANNKSSLTEVISSIEFVNNGTTYSGSVATVNEALAADSVAIVFPTSTVYTMVWNSERTGSFIEFESSTSGTTEYTGSFTLQ